MLPRRSLPRRVPPALALLLWVGLAGCRSPNEPERSAAPAAARTAEKKPPAATESRPRPGQDLVFAVEQARQLLHQGLPQSALEALEPHVGRPDADLTFHARHGRALFELGRHQEAAEAYRKASVLAPDNADVQFNLGLSLLEASRLILGGYLVHEDAAKEARTALEKAARLQPQDPRHLHALGRAAELLQEREEALRLFTEAIALDGRHAGALTRRGAVLSQLGRPDEAIAPLMAAREVAPRDADAAYHLGKVLLQLGNHEEAAESLEAATRLDPLSRESFYNLAIALARSGRDSDSAAARQRFEQLGDEMDTQTLRLAMLGRDGRAPDDPRMHFLMGMEEEMQGRIEAAVAHYERALAADDGLFEGHLRLAAIRLNLGQLIEAEMSLRRAIELQPSAAIAHVYLAGALEKQGRLDEAIEALRAATVADPTWSSPRRSLGLLLARTGRIEEGRQEVALAEQLAAAEHGH